MCRGCYGRVHDCNPNTSAVKPSAKPLKEWDELGHSQKNVRKRKASEYMAENKVPLEVLKKPRHNPERVVHLSTAHRKLINREDKSMPAEKNVSTYKLKVANTLGMETKSFFF
jgi:hypothetical protein